MTPSYLNCILIIGVHIFHLTNGEDKLETFCNVDGNRALQQVSEKFLSISIDPAVLLAGLNLSESSLLLVQHLSPAYIRIAGPSTKFVRYQDNEDRSSDRPADDGNSVVVTPSMWFGINEYLRLANLTPVFGINDVETARGVWNPKSILPLLEISDKLNVSCFWQLGFDSSPKTEIQYKQDLNILYHLLSAFPERNETWKIVGGDISTLPTEHTENTMEELRDIVTAVMWEPQQVSDSSFPEKDLAWKILHQQHKPNVKIWTSVPKSSEPISFASALQWAMQVGEAAKLGYEVVFRQPRLHEIFSDTPAYWVSLLHKKLMGSIVLDATPTISYPGSATYAHCTRKQGDSVGGGSLTVMVVNNNLQKYKSKVKLGAAPLEKNMQVLCYILTSTENSTDVFLNGKKLTMDHLSNPDIFKPKLRRTRSKIYISLEVPPKSIGFFVIPGAKIPVCVNEEQQVNDHIQEMVDEQNLPLSKENKLDLESRGLFDKNPTLKDIAQRMKKEMESDEKFYGNNSVLDDVKRETHSGEGRPSGKSLIEKARLAAKERKRLDLEKRKGEFRKFLSEKTKAANIYNPEARIESKPKNLELTSAEVEKILKDRAKARAAQRNIIFTDEELDALLQKASKQFMKSKYKGPVLEENSRRKRAIKMEVLDKVSLSSSEENSTEEVLVLFDVNQRLSPNVQKRLDRKPRDINSKLLDIRSKLAENKQRMEDKRYEILGNTQTIKENLMEKIRNLKYKNRYRRDINMDLLKIKTEGQKKIIQRNDEKKPFKSWFKNKEAKEATIRKPGETSAELLEESEEEEEVPMREHVKPKIEVFAELADPEDEDEEEEIDFFKRGKKLGRFDKKPNDPFSIINPTPRTTRKRKKEKNALEENLQFLTTSEEFTDIEHDLPCIHEFFGSDLKGTLGNKKKKVKSELGEVLTSERKSKKGKQGTRKMDEVIDIMMSSEKDPFEEIRIRRDAQCGNSPTVVDNGSDDFKIEDEILGEEPKDMVTSTTDSLALDDHSVSQNSFVAHDLESTGNKLAENKNSMTKLPTSHKEVITFEENDNSSAFEDYSDVYSNSDQMDEITEGKTGSPSLRRKRSIGQKVNAENEYKSNTRKCPKDIEQLMINDKLKFEEEKQRNKLKLAYMKKQQEEIAKDKHIVKEIHQIEQFKTHEVLKQLQLLQKILTQRKKDLDKCLVSDEKSQERKEEKKRSKSKDKQQILTTMYDNPRIHPKRKEPQIIDIKKETIKLELKELPLDMKKEPKFNERVTQRVRDASPPLLHKSKRSLFDKYPGGFGNYKPLTVNLKSWRPSDIMSMKRDSNLLTSRNLRPTNDYQLYTNMFDKNRNLSLRKRSINGNFVDLDNHISKDSDDIDEDTKYIHPKTLAGKGESSVPSNSLNNNKEKHRVMKFNKEGMDLEEPSKYTVSKIIKEAKKPTASLLDSNKPMRGDERVEYVIKDANDVRNDKHLNPKILAGKSDYTSVPSVGLNENSRKEHIGVTMDAEGNIKYVQPKVVTEERESVSSPGSIVGIKDDDIKAIEKEVNDVKENNTKYVQLITGNTDPMRLSVNISDLNGTRKNDEHVITSIKNDSTLEVTSMEGTYLTDSTVDPIIYYTFEYDFEPELQSDTDDIANSTVEARTEDVSKKVHGMLGTFMGNMTGFFKNVGSQIGDCLKRMVVF